MIWLVRPIEGLTLILDLKKKTEILLQIKSGKSTKIEDRRFSKEAVFFFILWLPIS